MNTKKGFTLIELLVVIAIIGILSSVVLASLNTAREKARDAKRISDIKNTQLALELYFDTNKEYPETLGALATAGFIQATPTGPLSSETYYYGAYVDSALTDACVGAETCLYYHLGADLEQSGHSSLDGDADDDSTVITSGSVDTSDCVAAVGVSRYCYDVTQ